MDKTLVAGPVAYIGDCDEDIALLQKASVAILVVVCTMKSTT